MADNTGYLIQPTLKYVTDDVDEFPLDINGDLCSVSLLAQATMSTSISDPRYKVLNTTICPLPTPPPLDDVVLSIEVTEPSPQTGGTNLYGAKVTISEALDNDLTVGFVIDYEVVPSGTNTHTSSLIILQGELTAESPTYLVTDASPAATATATIDSALPNPNGGKNITW